MKFFAGFKLLSLRRKMVRSELGKNLLTAAETALASDEPWKVRNLEEAIEDAPVPAYERAAIEAIIRKAARSKAKEIYHEAFTKYMFGHMTLEDVRRNAKTLGKHGWDKEQYLKKEEEERQLQAQRAQVNMNELKEYLRQQALQNYASPKMFGQLGASDQGIYDAMTDSYLKQR